MQIILNEADVVAAVQTHLSTVLPGLIVTEVEIEDGVFRADVAAEGSQEAKAPKKRRRRSPKAEKPTPEKEAEPANDPVEAAPEEESDSFLTPEADAKAEESEAPATSGISLFG